MPPALSALETIDIDLPDYPAGHHPFGFDQKPTFYKEIADTAEGDTARTQFFEKNLVALYLALNRPVPYAFRTRDKAIRHLDAGCVKFLHNRRTRHVELIYDNEGYIIAVRPLDPLLTRYDLMRTKLLHPYSSLIRSLPLPFKIDDQSDERRRVERLQVIRDGADAFRGVVFANWRSRCAISRIALPQVLQAAHIFPYRGPLTDSARNSILLRSDLHTLFDCFLLSLEYVSDKLMVRVSERLTETPYSKLGGREIRLPADPFCQPATSVVRYHFEKFNELASD